MDHAIEDCVEPAVRRSEGNIAVELVWMRDSGGKQWSKQNGARLLRPFDQTFSHYFGIAAAVGYRHGDCAVPYVGNLGQKGKMLVVSAGRAR